VVIDGTMYRGPQKSWPLVPYVRKQGCDPRYISAVKQSTVQNKITERNKTDGLKKFDEKLKGKGAKDTVSNQKSGSKK